MIVKVCGMREAENVRQVAALGIDMMGFIFYEKSPRCAQTPIVRCAEDQGVKRIGVFVDETETYIMDKVRDFDLDGVQLHGHESAAFCQRLRQQGIHLILKAISVKAAADLQSCEAYEGIVDYFVFDTKTPGYGGSGTQFDWAILQHYQGSVPFLLSGGIGPHNSQQLLRFQHPRWCGVDLNSRFETAPGKKDTDLLRSFLQKIPNR